MGSNNIMENIRKVRENAIKATTASLVTGDIVEEDKDEKEEKEEE